MRHHQHLVFKNWINGVHRSRSRSIHPVEMSERQKQDQDQRCQSGQSAKNSVIFSGGDSSKNYGPDQQRRQISDLHFNKFSTPATFGCWKIRFMTEVCTCSQFPTEAVQWIKEVEMVDPVDDLKSSSSTRGIPMPNFEVLDARIASAWTKSSIILTSKEESAWRNKRPRNSTVSFAEGRLLSWFTTTSGSLESMILSRNYVDLFTISLRNDDIQEFDSRWDGFFCLWRKSHLGRIVQIKNTRVWKTQDRIGIVWPGDSSEEIRTSASTEQRRTGVLSSARIEGWRERTKCSSYEQWSVDYCGARRSGMVHRKLKHLETGSRDTPFFVCWRTEFKWHSCVKRLPSSIWLLPKTATKRQIDGKDGWGVITVVVNTQFYELSKNPKSGLLSSQEHWLDQLVKFMLWKLLASMEKKLEFSTIRNPKDTSVVVISRETERFVNELHQLKREFKSSNKLLQEESKEERVCVTKREK